MKRGRMKLMTRNEGDDGIVVVVCGNTRDVEEVPFLFEFCCVLSFALKKFILNCSWGNCWVVPIKIIVV